MTCSLWRDGQLVGRVVLELPSTDGIAGVFVPTVAFDDLAPLMQIRLGIPSAPSIMQVPMTGPHARGPVALDRLSTTEAGGVPRHLRLELRDPAGVPIAHRLIAIDRLPPAPHGHPDLVREACVDANVPYSE